MSALASFDMLDSTPNAPSAAHKLRSKLIEKIEEQVRFANDTIYAPAKMQLTRGEDGVERLLEVPKRMHCWWHEAADGKVVLTIRYGSMPLELEKGVTEVICSSVADVAELLDSIKQAVADGEFDALLEAQVGFGE